jgi:hypothetical protein
VSVFLQVIFVLLKENFSGFQDYTFKISEKIRNESWTANRSPVPGFSPVADMGLEEYILALNCLSVSEINLYCGVRNFFWL